MTSAVATADFSFGGTDITDLDGIILDRFERGGPGELPITDGKDDPVPGADGVFVRNRRKRTRTIELKGWVFGTGSTVTDQIKDYWDNRESVESIFAPDDHDDLVALLRNGRTATIDAWPVSIDFDQRAPMAARVSIVLLSTEPDWTIETTSS